MFNEKDNINEEDLVYILKSFNQRLTAIEQAINSFQHNIKNASTIYPPFFPDLKAMAEHGKHIY